MTTVMMMSFDLRGSNGLSCIKVAIDPSGGLIYCGVQMIAFTILTPLCFPQVTNFIIYFREQIWGIPLEELQRRRQERKDSKAHERIVSAEET